MPTEPFQCVTATPGDPWAARPTQMEYTGMEKPRHATTSIVHAQRSDGCATFYDLAFQGTIVRDQLR